MEAGVILQLEVPHVVELIIIVRALISLAEYHDIKLYKFSP